MKSLLRAALLLLCPALLSFAARAQTQFSVYAGAGYPYVTATKSKVSNNFAAGAHVAALLHIPVSKRIGVETGVSYTEKGLVNQDTLRDADYPRYAVAYRLRSKMGYLGFPLVLTYRMPLAQQHTLLLGVGMTYNFMIHGNTKGWMRSLRDGQADGKQEVTLPVKPRLMPATDDNGSPFYLFDVAVKLQVSYVWRGRYGVRLFHEHSLYSYHIPDAGSETRLRYTGLALSFSIPRASAQE